ncbi:MAG: DNA polymerase III subunit gamma/tau [Oscillospiraceae bacterium]
MYQALYRKWRPLTFDDVVGQEHITCTLKKQVAADRLSHAYLFIGTRGTGKTTCAKILARAVNCEHPVDGNPCNECAACRGILDGSILDVVELDAASNNGVSDVRALQDEAIFSPASVKKRVYIIDEVHMLSVAAFNALLKILEEPPEHLMFILCTTELHKVLATIVSRCQRHSFKRIEPDVIAGRLSYVAGQEGLALDPDAAALLARMADGGMRDALSLLDQCSAREHIDADAVRSALGLAGSRRIEALLEAVCAHDPERALTQFDALWKDGKDPSGILEELGDLMRDVLLMQVAPRSAEALLSGVYDRQALQRFAAQLTGSDLMDGMAAIRAADLSGQSPRRAAEMCLVSLCVPETGDSLSALKSRVSRLETALQNGVAVPAAPVNTEPAPEKPPVSDDIPPWFTDDDAPPEESAFMPPPVPEPETPKRSEPERPAPAFVPPVGGDTNAWDELVRRLNGKMELATYSMLTAGTQTSGVLTGDVMTVYLANPFAKMMLDTPDVAELFRCELREITGRPVRVIFTDEARPAPAAPDTGKLDALSKFANVKFE